MADVEAIRQLATRRAFRLTRHAQLERMADGITEQEIEEALAWGELVEDYPDDPRGPSCLLLGFAEESPLHIVCGILSEMLIIITVYRPSSDEWEPDWRERKIK